MKYVCLIYQDETGPQKMPKAEMDKAFAEYSAKTSRRAGTTS
jgi:hypothetical protein